MKFYIISYCAYGTGEFLVSSFGCKTKKEAEEEAKRLRSCGHKNVTVTAVTVNFPK